MLAAETTNSLLAFLLLVSVNIKGKCLNENNSGSQVKRQSLGICNGVDSLNS